MWRSFARETPQINRSGENERGQPQSRDFERAAVYLSQAITERTESTGHGTTMVLLCVYVNLCLRATITDSISCGCYFRPADLKSLTAVEATVQISS